MRTHIRFTLFLMVLALASCGREAPVDQDFRREIQTITVLGPESIRFETMTDTELTKGTSVQDGNTLLFNWAVGDTLGIFPSKGNQVEFPITEAQGSTSATFDGGGWALKNNASYAAYYPFSPWNYFRDNETILLDYSGQVQDGNGSFAHLSAFDFLASNKTAPQNNAVTFQMERQGSILYIDIVVPEPETIRSLIISCDEAIFVEKAGLDISGNTPVVTPVTTTESLTLSFVNTATTTDNETVRAYMALQPVDFSEKTVTATLVTENGRYTAPVTPRVVNKGRAAFLRFSDDFAEETIQFEDATFKEFCVLDYDTNHDGEISITEANNITSLRIEGRTITSLKGIESFSALTELICKGCHLTSLDVSNNTALKTLSCDYNQLSSLDLSNNTSLVTLTCNYNQLTGLDVSINTALTSLGCSYNQLASLDVSNNTALTHLDCSANPLTGLNLSNNAELSVLLCNQNYYLPNIDVSHNTALIALECRDNELESLDVSNNTNLTELDCRNNPNLTEIWLSPGQEIADMSYDAEVATIKYRTGLYSFSKAYALPEHDLGDIITLYETQTFSKYVSFKTTAGKPDSLIIRIEGTDRNNFRQIVDTIWNGNQSTQQQLDMSTGLQTVYEDFSRSYLYDLDAPNMSSYRAALAAYAGNVQNEYDRILNILTSAKEGQGRALVKAWRNKVSSDTKSIDVLAKEVDKYTNYDDLQDNNVYRYEDNVLSTDMYGPRVAFHYDTTPRIVTQDPEDETHFILDAVSSPWFDVAPANALSIAPTEADSALIVNTIKQFYAAIASINERAVPYLKYISTVGSSGFKVDSVRADMIDFSGFKMTASVTRLDEIGIHRTSRYDNKGVNNVNVSPTDASDYVDALTNLIELFNHYVHNDAMTLPIYTYHDYDYTDVASGVGAYCQYVIDFWNTNTTITESLDCYRKAFNNYSVRDFQKYTSLSDEGRAVADWMDACEKYYGVEGFAGLGEEIFFDYSTFTDPTSVVVFTGFPAFGYDENQGVVTCIRRVDVVNPWSNQYAFVAKSIWANLCQYDGITYDAQSYTGWNNASMTGASNSDLVMKSLVFELLEANYLVELANNTKPNREIWEELGAVLNQVKADLDAVTAE